MTRYTESQKQWLLENGGKMFYKELTELFNKTFNTNKKYDAIRKYCLKKLKIFIGANELQKVKNIDYLMELYKNNVDMPMKEIAKIFNQKFGTHYKEDTLERLMHERGLKKTLLGHTQGNIRNESPLYSIKNNTAGFEMIKVKNGTKERNYNDGWTTLANYRYEQYHNEKLGENEFVIFVNGNNRDYRKENLIKITKAEHLSLNQEKMYNKGECTTTMLEIIRAKAKIKEFALMGK